MQENHETTFVRKVTGKANSSNVKATASKARRERFGEAIRYLTVDELNRFIDVIDDFRHKLMMRMMYELGCRVGEFVHIRLKHLSFARSNVFFPAENTKTRQRRISHLPVGLMNDIKSLLRAEGRLATRSDRVFRPDTFLFFSDQLARRPYTANRIRQLFRRYIILASLDRDYGLDSRGRTLHELTVHSLRHSHIMHYVHEFRLPLPLVQKQVGHKSLKTTSIYLRPSDEQVGQAYADVRRAAGGNNHSTATRYHLRQMAKRPQSLNTVPSSFGNDITKNKTRHHAVA